MCSVFDLGFISPPYPCPQHVRFLSCSFVVPAFAGHARNPAHLHQHGGLLQKNTQARGSSVLFLVLVLSTRLLLSRSTSSPVLPLFLDFETVFCFREIAVFVVPLLTLVRKDCSHYVCRITSTEIRPCQSLLIRGPECIQYGDCCRFYSRPCAYGFFA